MPELKRIVTDLGERWVRRPLDLKPLTAALDPAHGSVSAAVSAFVHVTIANVVRWLNDLAPVNGGDRTVPAVRGGRSA